MVLSMLAVHQAANDLLQCTCTFLAQLPTEVPGLAGCPCRVFVAPGTPAADGCDGNCGTVPDGEYPGQLTVNVVRIYPTDRQSFPRYSPSQPSSVMDARNCTPPQTTAVDLTVTLFRCVPGPTNDGCPPTPAALGDAAMQLHADMLKMQQAVLCCYAETDTTRRGGRRFTLGAASVIGPQGDCIGIQQQVSVALDDCLPCPEVTP